MVARLTHLSEFFPAPKITKIPSQTGSTRHSSLSSLPISILLSYDQGSQREFRGDRGQRHISSRPMTIPYQKNEGGLVALLPDGRVEFLHPAALPLLNAARLGSVEPLNFEDYILSSPLVRLDRFHLAAPAIAFIEITNLCNLRCQHCYAWSGPTRPNEMTTERIIGLLDEFAEAGVLQVFLTGGEIFAHSDAIQIINHARTKPFSTQIFTNGLLITEEKLASIHSSRSS
jgi:sulfatase maturation enzyme AslB (radical SAM superfamily)